jgi:hypothetical protein
LVKVVSSLQNSDSAGLGSIPHAFAASAGSVASAVLTLTGPTDVVVFASYLSTTATPSGSGSLVVAIDGIEHTVTPLSVAGGEVLPTTGMLFMTKMAAGAHTISVQAAFTGPPATNLAGVSVAAFSFLG